MRKATNDVVKRTTHKADNIRNTPYGGPRPDYSGQIRCHTGEEKAGKDIIILIYPHQFDAKLIKYPKLRNLGPA